MQQLFSLVGALFPLLLEFDDVSADQSIGRRHECVHASRRSAPGLVNEAHNAMEHCLVRVQRTAGIRDADFTKGLFRAAYNRNAPWAVTDFDAAQFLARFQID